MSDEEIEEVDRIPVGEFDDGARILIMNDGSLRLRLSYMPPSWSNGADGPFDDFTPALAAALGVPVVGLDKELFAIPKPAADTADRLRRWLLSLRK